MQGMVAEVECNTTNDLETDSLRNKHIHELLERKCVCTNKTFFGIYKQYSIQLKGNLTPAHVSLLIYQVKPPMLLFLINAQLFCNMIFAIQFLTVTKGTKIRVL